MIVTVPGEMPVTIPEDEPTVAIVVLLLYQLPPVTVSDNEVVLPTQTVVIPDIGSGTG